MKLTEIKTNLNDSHFKTLVEVCGSDDGKQVPLFINTFQVYDKPAFEELNDFNDYKVSYLSVIWNKDNETFSRHFLFVSHVAKNDMRLFQIDDFEDDGVKLFSVNRNIIDLDLKTKKILLNPTDNYVMLYDSIVPSGVFDMLDTGDSTNIGYIEPNETSKFDGTANLVSKFLDAYTVDGELPSKHLFADLFGHLFQRN